MFQNHRLMPKEWEILVTILIRYNVQIHSIITKRCGDRRDWFCTRTSSFSVGIGKTKKRCFKLWKTLWCMLLIPLCLLSFYWLPRLETLFFLQDSYVVLNRVLRTNILLLFFFFFPTQILDELQQLIPSPHFAGFPSAGWPWLPA